MSDERDAAVPESAPETDSAETPDASAPPVESAAGDSAAGDSAAGDDAVCDIDVGDYPPGPLCEDRIREELKKVIDPELFVNIVDLGLIYTVAISDGEEAGKHHILIEMTMTSPMCPAGPQLIGQSKQVVMQIEEVSDVEVKVVMDPPWTPDKMTDDARDQLGIF